MAARADHGRALVAARLGAAGASTRRRVLAQRWALAVQDAEARRNEMRSCWCCVLPAARRSRRGRKRIHRRPGVQPVSAPMAMPGLGRERRIRVYLPPGYASSTRRYPVLYMHDGQNLFDEATGFAGEWGVDETLDRLARERGLEVIVVGIDNGQEHRINELKPWADAKYGPAKPMPTCASWSKS
jgi:enterochelin esterase-like enzyme